MRLLTENLRWKVLALVASAALWYGLVRESDVATSLPVAVQYRNIPPDLEISSDQFDRVYVRLHGPAPRLRTDELTGLSLVLDLSQVQGPGERTFNLNEDTLRLPPGVTLTRAVPSQVRLTFDRRAAREVPVDVRFAGPPPHGYRVSSQEVYPPKLRVMGPETRVNIVQSAQTDAIDLASTVSNAEFRVPAFIPDPHVRFEQQAPVVSVRVFMEKIPR